MPDLPVCQDPQKWRRDGGLAAVRRGKNLSSLEHGCLKAWLTEALWTKCRLKEAGLAENDDCQLCGQKDTIEHRFLTCPATNDLRAKHLTGKTLNLLSDQKNFFKTGWLRDPGFEAPPPSVATGEDQQQYWAEDPHRKLGDYAVGIRKTQRAKDRDDPAKE